jgi:hypothetical protein
VVFFDRTGILRGASDLERLFRNGFFLVLHIPGRRNRDRF